MRKSLAILIAIVLCVGMTGCVSQRDYNSVIDDRDEIEEEYEKLKDDYDNLEEDYESLREELNDNKEKLGQITEEYEDYKEENKTSDGVVFAESIFKSLDSSIQCTEIKSDYCGVLVISFDLKIGGTGSEFGAALGTTVANNLAELRSYGYDYIFIEFMSQLGPASTMKIDCHTLDMSRNDWLS